MLAGNLLKRFVIGNHHHRICLKPTPGNRLKQSLGGMGLKGGKKGHALAAVGWVEVHLDFHTQGIGKILEIGLDPLGIPSTSRPGGLKSHAKLSPSHLLLKGEDVGTLDKQTMGYLRNNTTFVSADDRDGSHSQ